MRKIFFVFFTFLYVFTFAQSNSLAWKVNDIKLYQGAYFFGESEMEYALIIIVDDDKQVYGQFRFYAWNEENQKWVGQYINLKNVSIEDNKFFCDTFNGEFIEFKLQMKKKYALRTANPWYPIWHEGKYEIAKKSSVAIEKFFPGKYPETSLRKLSESELKNYTNFELKTMRNEIFARYGYKFIPDGEMDEYFKQKKWYTPVYKNVYKFLTGIEKYNINLISQIEKK